jgi:hypothetical protein
VEDGLSSYQVRFSLVELRADLQGRRQGYLFEGNRHTLYSVRTVQAAVERFARQAGIAKRVFIPQYDIGAWFNESSTNHRPLQREDQSFRWTSGPSYLRSRQIALKKRSPQSGTLDEAQPSLRRFPRPEYDQLFSISHTLQRFSA